MKAATVAFALCLLVHARGSHAGLLFFPKAAEYTGFPTTVETTTPLYDYSSTYDPSSTTYEIPTSTPSENPTTPSNPSRPHCTLIVVTLDAGKLLLNELGKLPQLPLHAISAVGDLLKPLTSLPMETVKRVEDALPIHSTLDSLKKVLDDTIQIPKDVLNTGESVVGDLVNTLSGL